MGRKSEVYEKLGYNIKELYHYIHNSRILDELKTAAEMYHKIEEVEMEATNLHKKLADKERAYHEARDRNTKYELGREVGHLRREWKTKVQHLHYYSRTLKKAHIKKELLEFKARVRRVFRI